MGGSIYTGTLKITPKILKLITEIDEFKGAWAAIGRISPDSLTALRRVATIESIGSSTRIEGKGWLQSCHVRSKLIFGGNFK